MMVMLLLWSLVMMMRVVGIERWDGMGWAGLIDDLISSIVCVMKRRWGAKGPFFYKDH